MGYLPASLCQHLMPHRTLNNYLVWLTAEDMLSEKDFIEILLAFISSELYEDLLEKLVSERHYCNHHLVDHDHQMDGAMLPTVGVALELLQIEGTLTINDVSYLKYVLRSKNVGHILRLQIIFKEIKN